MPSLVLIPLCMQSIVTTSDQGLKNPPRLYPESQPLQVSATHTHSHPCRSFHFSFRGHTLMPVFPNFLKNTSHPAHTHTHSAAADLGVPAHVARHCAHECGRGPCSHAVQQRVLHKINIKIQKRFKFCNFELHNFINFLLPANPLPTITFRH